MSKRGRGRVALPPGDKRRIKVSPHFTEGEAARLDAVRGEVERAEWLRVVAMREVGRRERGIARAAKVARGAVCVGLWRAVGAHMVRNAPGSTAWAALVNPAGWSLMDGVMHPETGPEGQRLADAALRAAGYVLADGGEA